MCLFLQLSHILFGQYYKKNVAKKGWLRKKIKRWNGHLGQGGARVAYGIRGGSNLHTMAPFLNNTYQPIIKKWSNKPENLTWNFLKGCAFG